MYECMYVRTHMHFSVSLGGAMHFVCIHLCMHACMYVYKNSHALRHRPGRCNAEAGVYPCIRNRSGRRARLYAVHMHVPYVCMYVCMYAFVYIYIYIYMYMYIYTHTTTHGCHTLRNMYIFDLISHICIRILSLQFVTQL